MKLLFLFMLFSAPTWAHDGVHDRWFESLTQPVTGLHCCGGTDCVPTEATTSGDHWRARLPNGVWADVPNDRVVTDKGNPVGQPVLCARRDSDGSYTVLCFIPGALL